jgi:tRNA-specific 2-thiouridylase
MSGGVDSSVAAALLHETGEEVFGLMLRLSGPGSDLANRCCSPADVEAARQVAHTLGFPFYVLDAREAFEREVVAPFVSGYAQGATPNPCIECNRSIRWGLLLEHALASGATHLATGHYARLDERDGRFHLRAATDERKDQSYVLHVLSQAQLGHALFPLGALAKEEVRAHARRLNLPTAERAESQDLCFIDGDYRAFLARRGVEASPGPILDERGNELGRHTGIPNYTLGQRKGLGVSAPEALFVLEKDLRRNALVVGPSSRVGRSRFALDHVHWVAGSPMGEEFEAHVQVRYHAPRLPAQVRSLGPSRADVVLATRRPDVAPGQSAVFYDGDDCLGGGIIQP